MRRAETGEQFTVTVSGRPVAQLGPIRGRAWVDAHALEDLWALPTDASLLDDFEGFGELRDPWA